MCTHLLASGHMGWAAMLWQLLQDARLHDFDLGRPGLPPA